MAETYGSYEKDKEADFVFVYDTACAALASLRARLQQIFDDPNLSVPSNVGVWALNSKWLVDKFHFKNHVGVQPDQL